MNIETTNTILEIFALLNEGANHQFDLSLELISTEGSLEQTLQNYFSKNDSSQHMTNDWNITFNKMQSSWQTEIKNVIHHWFFGMPYSPKLDSDRNYVSDLITEKFLEHLVSTVHDADASEVFTQPPESIWYEAHWKDFVFQNGKNTWFLHLGVSD